MTIPASIGKYRIEGILGEGGMGVVYKALDPVIRRTVALKTVVKARLDPSLGRSALDRFRNEAQAAGRLLHPGIVAVYDYGEDDEIAFIVMEYVRGRSLHDHLSNETRYDLREAWQILGQLLDAVGYSHAHGVVHRDLKPANILINDDGRIKISDFGIARMDSNHFTEHGEVVGTLYYMAPEQIRGDRVDHRADLYSVGIICYQLLTGRRPFAGTPMEVMNQVLEFMPVDPSRLNPELPRDLDHIVRKALAKRADERFQSARELAERLRQVIDRAAVAAPAAPPRVERPAPRPVPGLLDAARRINLSHSLDSLPDIDITAAPPAVVAPARGRILCVDDEERILNALRSSFRADYDVTTAGSGEQALQALRNGEFDVVLSDQRMPKMQGVELLRRVREISPDTVRLLLTGYSDLASIVGSINDGEIYRFVSKPWDNQELARIVKEAVAVSQALREVRHAPAPSIAFDGTLLVVESEPDMIRTVRELYGRHRRVLYAPSGDEALDLMLNEDVSVLLADVDGNPAQMATMLKLLKQEQPQVLAIVATSASDSELVIELVNQAQIYRFLNKPLNASILKQHLESAMARHRALRQSPALAQQQKVEPTPAAVRESAFARNILSKLRLLKRRVVGV